MPHNPGSLVEALDIFKQNKLNLTWIESFPAKTGKQEYMFFVDFEGHVEDPKVKRALTFLEQHCEELAILGSFPIATGEWLDHDHRSSTRLQRNSEIDHVLERIQELGLKPH